MRDKKSNLYPFLMAAAAVDKPGDPKNYAAENQSHFGKVVTELLRLSDENCYDQLGTIFVLLEEDPSLIRLLVGE